MSQPKLMQELSSTVCKLSRVMTEFIQLHMKNKGLADIRPTSSLLLLLLLEKEGQTLTGLARTAHIKAPTITVIANRLEKKGWIKRKRGRDDRRQVQLYLTQTGRGKAELIASIHRSAARLMSDCINRDSIIVTNETLNRIISNVNNHVV